MNQTVPPQAGQPAWTKVHAKIDEGPDGKIYFCCTLNASGRAGEADYKWTEQLPGAQLYQYDPQTGQTIAYANLPAKRCSATSLFDERRNIWWCNLEADEIRPSKMKPNGFGLCSFAVIQIPATER